eukprot:403374352
MIAKLKGYKQENSPYIIDKNDIQEIALAICKKFHSKMLIPTRSPALIVEKLGNDHVKMTVKGTTETFQFPLKDCVLLDLEYTSIEDLATYCTQEIKRQLQLKGNEFNNLTQIFVTVREYEGLECEMCDTFNRPKM